MSKVALITGSAKGIGAAIVKEFAKNGIDVIINYNTSEKQALDLKEFVCKYNVRCKAIKCDISNQSQVKEMVDQINKEFGGIDILVNNAAIDIDQFFYKKDLESFRKTLEVNVIAAFNLAKIFSKHMIENKWGRIINISSTNGINSYYPICLEYDASKAALNSLTHNLAVQLSPYVNVNSVAPGFIGTEAELTNMDENFIKEEQEKILVKRVGKPEDVANLVYFLVTDKSDFINNSIIRIDGGQYGSN